MSILTEYKNSLKMVEAEETLDLYFYRPLAFVFVKAVYRTAVTPNQVTILAMLLGVLGGASYAFGTQLAYVFGAVFYCIYNVLDCSDGQLARLKDNGTRLGRIFDGLSDYVVSIAAYTGIAIGFANNSSDPLLWWIIAAGAGLSYAFQQILFDCYRNRFLDVVLDRVSLLEDDIKSFQEEYHYLKRRRGRSFRKVVIWVYLRYSEVQRRLTLISNKSNKTRRFAAEEYYRNNKTPLRFWSCLGSSTNWTFLVLTSVINRLDIFLLGRIVVGNVIAILMLVIQNRIDNRLQGREKE